MTDTEGPKQFHLHFEGDRVREHTIPAGALVQAIEALQRAVHMIAMHYEGRSVEQRLRVSHEMESKYAVVFGVPRDGGYDLPYTIGPVDPVRIFDKAQSQDVAGLFGDVLEAISTGNEVAFRRAIPAASVRKAVAGELKKMQPPKRSGIFVSIEDGSGQKLLDGKRAVAAVNALVFDQPQPTIRPRLITGRLDELDFQARSLRLQLPTGKPLTGRYGEDFEPVLVDNRREWIQVRGEAVLDDKDRIKSIENISEIIEVDTSPIEISEFILNGKHFVARAPLIFSVGFDAEAELYTAEGPFHVLATGETRDELEVAVYELFALLWEEYVAANAATLSEDALELRASLKTTFGDD